MELTANDHKNEETIINVYDYNENKEKFVSLLEGEWDYRWRKNKERL